MKKKTVLCGVTLVLSFAFVNSAPLIADDVDGLVRSLIRRHYVKSVTPAELEAQIYPAFWARCDLDQKRATVKILAMYCKKHEPQYGGAVTLKDARSGKKLAEYGVFGGVKIVGEDD